MSDDFFSVSGLNNFIRDVINSGFPKSVWVCGEIQELREKNNHLYFTLSEKDPQSNQVVAKIGVSIWANARLKIDAILRKAENAFVLKEDIEVKLLCKVDFYPPFGQVRLIVEGIDPVYTLGKIAQDRQRMIAALRAKGILDLNKRISVPRVPLNIGLITSYDSAAYHDFTDELKQSSHAFKVFLVNAVMQGKNTEGSVCQALAELKKIPLLDVVIITRGGGSVTELSSFDSAKIAEMVAHMPVPVFSGIGHEINTTVTDLAAHAFFKTPTAVAQFLIGRVEEFLDHLSEREELILQGAKACLEHRTQQLKDYALTLQRDTHGMLTASHKRMEAFSEVFKRLPVSVIREAKRCLNDREEDLKKTIHLHLQKSRDKIHLYQKLVDLADPKNILKRGFSITKDSKGNIIRSAQGIKSSDGIITELIDGVLISQVKEVRSS